MPIRLLWLTTWTNQTIRSAIASFGSQGSVEADIAKAKARTGRRGWHRVTEGNGYLRMRGMSIKGERMRIFSSLKRSGQ